MVRWLYSSEAQGHKAVAADDCLGCRPARSALYRAGMTSDKRRWRARLAWIAAWHQQWEARNVGRIGGWSTRRRWLAFVQLPLLVFCCGGTVIGLPAMWVIGETVEASRGAPTPEGAADEYLSALSHDNTDGLVSVLDDDHQDQLLEDWRTYRTAMEATDPPPFALDYGPLTASTVGQSRAQVTADVSARWWSTDDNGRLNGFASAGGAMRHECMCLCQLLPSRRGAVARGTVQPAQPSSVDTPPIRQGRVHTTRHTDIF